MECNKLFVYGILKKGFCLDLSKEGATFIGEATLQPANLYAIGSGVGLRIEDEGKVYGEVFEIPQFMWRWLDRIENHPYTYMRQLVQVFVYQKDAPAYELDAYVYVHQHPQYFDGLIESGNYQLQTGEVNGHEG